MVKKRVLLTGASGNVGFYTLKELLTLSSNYSIRIFALGLPEERKKFKPYLDRIETVYGNLTNLSDVERALKDVDIVIHVAAIIPPLADRKPELAEAVNVGGTENIITVIEKNHLTHIKLIFTSSISVYGDRVKNHQIFVTDPLKPSFGDQYAVTKIKAETLIKKSSIDWTIFRLTAITNPYYKLDPIMFHVPLNTHMEYCLAQDVAYCLVKAIESSEISHKIYNLGGGEKCRIIYREFSQRMLSIYGIRPTVLKDEFFATTNFHCGYYMDGNELEQLFHFQRGSLEDYLLEVKTLLSPKRKILYHLIPSFVIKRYFKSISEPYKAIKSQNKELMKRFHNSS